MRITALILGILGGLAAGALGAKWVSDYNSDAARAVLKLADSPRLRSSPLVKERLDRLKMIGTAGYLLLVSLLLGIGGGIMTLRNMGKIGGALLIVGAALPAVLAPITLVATFLLIIGAIFAFLAKPNPARGPAMA